MEMIHAAKPAFCGIRMLEQHLRGSQPLTPPTVGAARKLALSRTLVESTSKYLDQVREQIKGVEKFWAYSLVGYALRKRRRTGSLHAVPNGHDINRTEALTSLTSNSSTTKSSDTCVPPNPTFKPSRT